MSDIEELQELLKDEKWHDLKQIMEKFRLNRSQQDVVLNFLAEYKFILLDKERRKLRLTPSVLNFLKNIQRIEEGG